ncbi:MAG: VTC domain-containing protein, partial [Lachnospiraceae bacterium]|nr:VTC domain-containing protein [Lachnospiraceae bacterium]
IRSYNRSADRISLECKRRESGMILKKSCLLTPDQFRDLMEGRPLPVSDRNPALLNRFLIERRTRFFTPRVIVSYQRRPFICPQGNVRVTFDRNIAASASFDRFFEHSLPQRPILQAGMQLLEVKYDDYLPDHIYHAIQMTSMRQETFSKYYLCRHYYHGGREHVI